MACHMPLQPKALCVSSMFLTIDNAQNNALEGVMKETVVNEKFL